MLDTGLLVTPVGRVLHAPNFTTKLDKNMTQVSVPTFESRPSGRMTKLGWLSSYGLLLNLQCVKCRVCVSIDEKGKFIEFDGMPHHCTPAQAVKRGSLL